LSLIIPAFNEEATIRQAITEADDVLRELAGDYEILVVDDGSDDGTFDAARQVALDRPRVRLLRHAVNRGYGAALRTGFEAARFDRVTFTDADCQFHLHDLAALVPLADAYPLVVGYRVNRQDTWRRRFFSRGYNALARILLGTGVRDCDCALKVFRKEAVHDLLPESDGFFVNTEMLTRARQAGHEVVEVGVRHRHRLRGSSKVSLGDIPRTLAALLPFWWSKVLFPAQQTESAEPCRSWALDPGFWTVFLVAALLFFSRLHSPLLEPDEARYAEIPRQMLHEGRLVVPVLHGQPYYQEPPLLYWLVMAAYSIFGIHDWVARLVPCSAAFLTVLCTYFWGACTVGKRPALIGALILCLSARFVYLGRLLTMDSLLALWVILSWAAAHVAVRRPTLARGWWLLSALACGLGVLTKGPVALVLVPIPLAVLQALDPRTARPRWRAWSVYLLTAVALAGPWYVGMMVTAPGFASEFFWTANVLRLPAPLDHEGPIWSYVPGLLLGMLPWTFLLPSFGRFVARRADAESLRRPAELGLFILAFLWCLGFYSSAGCQRPGYIIPAMAPLALALGCYLHLSLPRDWFARTDTGTTQALSRLAYRCTLLVLVIGSGGSLVAVAADLQKPFAGLFLAVLTAAAAGVLLYRGPSRRPGLSWALCGGITLLLVWTGLHQVLPGYERKFSLRDQVRPAREVLADPHVRIVCYPHRWDSVSFYLQRNDVAVYAPKARKDLIDDLRAQPNALVFVKTDDGHTQALKDLLHDLPASLEFVPRGRHGIVTAGLIRRRTPVPAFLFAHR
jgi:dolichol-phosphate mannosyltransferase